MNTDTAPAEEASLLGMRQQKALEMRGERTKIELSLLKQYHGTTISHSNWSFSVGLFFGAVAFTFILWTLFTVINSGQFDQVQQVKLLSGLIFTAFSLLLVRQSTQAQRQMEEFLDKLRDDREAEEFRELARTIDDPEVRTRVKGLLALSTQDEQVIGEKAATLVARET